MKSSSKRLSVFLGAIRACAIMILVGAMAAWFSGWTIVQEDVPAWGISLERCSFDEWPGVNIAFADDEAERIAWLNHSEDTRHHIRIGHVGILTGRDGKHTEAEIETSERPFRRD